MPASRQFSRINTLELKSEMEVKLGRPKAELYFRLLTKFLSLKMSKLEFDKFCIGTIGKENLNLHNKLIRSIVRNATLSTMGPPKITKETNSLRITVPNGHPKNGLHSLCRDFPQSPRKGRRTPSFRDRKFKDWPSPLGPQGKSHKVPCEESTPKIQEQQSASELFSLGSGRPPCSDEDGEEVEQAAARKNPLVAPLGILEELKTRRRKREAPAEDSCRRTGGLPGTSSLVMRIRRRLGAEGINLSEECANLLNCGLDAYLKRLIKPCLELSGSRRVVDQGRCGQRVIPARLAASVLDFRVAVEMNPTLLGEDWPTKLEKVCSYAATEDKTGL